MSASRNIPAPKCGTRNGVFGCRSAIACRSSGFEKRMSNGDGRPSFLRTPTVSTPQCTNTAERWAAACSIMRSARSSCSEYRCIAGKRQMAFSPGATRTFSAVGFTIAYGRKRSGYAFAAASTEASSPGVLAIMAARATLWRFSSVAHVSASDSGSTGGRFQPSFACSAGTSCACDASDWKNLCEKKWTCASATGRSPQGVCIGLVPVRNPGGERKLRQAGDVIHAELLHHGLPIAADRLQAEVEKHCDVLRRLSLGHQSKHLQLARREGLERAAVVGFEIAALDTGQETIGDLRAEVRPAPRDRPQRVEQLAGRGLLEDECARARADRADHGIFVVVHR